MYYANNFSHELIGELITIMLQIHNT